LFEWIYEFNDRCAARVNWLIFVTPHKEDVNRKSYKKHSWQVLWNGRKLGRKISRKSYDLWPFVKRGPGHDQSFQCSWPLLGLDTPNGFQCSWPLLGLDTPNGSIKKLHDIMVQYHQRNKHLREIIITKFDKYNGSFNAKFGKIIVSDIGLIKNKIHFPKYLCMWFVST
jgi:hypothetical protein